MKFLIVDDDPAILRVTQKLIELQQHDVVLVDNALEAIQILTDLTFDIVITDATMPAYSGFDLIRSIKKRPDIDYLTIAMLTGRSDKSDIQQAVELGVDDYIVKPIDPSVFIEKTLKLTERHKKKPRQKPIQLHSNAHMLVPVTVTRFTDVGVTVEGPYALAKGTEVQMELNELKAIGIHKNRFKAIFNSESRNQSRIITELLLMELTTDEQKKLRHLSLSNKSTGAA